MKHLAFIIWVLFVVFIINTIASAQKHSCKTGIIYLDDTKVQKFVKGFKNEK